MTPHSGTLPTRWPSAPVSDLGRVPECQSARTPPARAHAYARTRAGRPPGVALCHSAQVDGLLILALCLALCPAVALCPGQSPFIRPHR